MLEKLMALGYEIVYLNLKTRAALVSKTTVFDELKENVTRYLYGKKDKKNIFYKNCP